MKHIAITLGLVFTTGIASANTVCSISRSTKGDSTFDQVLHSAPLTGPTYLIVRENQTQAESIDFEQMKTPEQWNAVNGETIVTFSAQPNDQYGITIGKVDLSKTDNALPLEAITIGTVIDGRPLSLMLFRKKLSMSCFQLQ